MTSKPETASTQFTSLHPDQSVDTQELIDAICDSFLEKKARDIVKLDVRDITTLTDFFIVCHGTSDTQIGALARNVIETTQKRLGEKAWKQEGMDTRSWIILDYVNVVVHIFNEEKRAYYGIEKMWNDAIRTEIVDQPSREES